MRFTADASSMYPWIYVLHFNPEHIVWFELFVWDVLGYILFWNLVLLFLTFEIEWEGTICYICKTDFY